MPSLVPRCHVHWGETQFAGSFVFVCLWFKPWLKCGQRLKHPRPPEQFDTNGYNDYCHISQWLYAQRKRSKENCCPKQQGKTFQRRMGMNGLATKTLGATKQESRDLHMTFLNREENRCHSCVLGDECSRNAIVSLITSCNFRRRGNGNLRNTTGLSLDPSLARYFHGSTSADQQTHHFQVAFESRQMQRRIASLILVQTLQHWELRLPSASLTWIFNDLWLDLLDLLENGGCLFQTQNIATAPPTVLGSSVLVGPGFLTSGTSSPETGTKAEKHRQKNVERIKIFIKYWGSSRCKSRYSNEH